MPENEVDKPLLHISNHHLSLRNISILLILAGVLVPSVIYSINLRSPTPTELLLAICITLFASVVYLWILDATDTLRFRSDWVSKSVYGAAIVSVLGTSVAVYKDFFSDRKYVYEGKWELTIQKKDADTYMGRFAVSMNYSENAGSYWGFSNFCVSCKENDEKLVWLEIMSFDEKTPGISLQAIQGNGSDFVIQTALEEKTSGKKFVSLPDSEYRVRLYRPK